MTDRIDDPWIDGVLRSVDATAPPDVRADVRRMLRGEVTPTDWRDGPRRRWPAPVAAAAAIAAIVGLAVIGGRDDDPMIGPADTDEPSVEPTVRPTTSIEDRPTTTAAPTPTTTPVIGEGAPQGHELPADLAASIDALLAATGLAGGEVVSGEAAAEALAAIDRHRLALWREMPGFSVSATFGSTWVLADGTKPRPDAPPTYTDVTVLANGDVWAEFDGGDWYSVDAETGISRGVYRNEVTGSFDALQVQRAPHRHHLGSVLGHDPLARLDGIPTRFGRLETPVIELQFDLGSLPPNVQVHVESDRLGRESYVVDLMTGLIVMYDASQPDEKGTLGRYSAMHDLVLVDELPIDDLPALPAGVEWQVLDDGTVAPTSVADAAEAFGPGLVLPEVALAGGTVALGQTASTGEGMGVPIDHPDAAVREVWVEVVVSDGFLRQVFRINASMPIGDGPAPDGFELVDGRLCSAPCETTPTPAEATVVPRAGALAGLGWTGADGFLVRTQDGIGYSVEATTDEEAVRLVETLADASGTGG